MKHPLKILKTMPFAADFYGLYWNRQPFVVRGAIAVAEFDGLISADELAGLAMEEGPQSRMVHSAGDPLDWSCAFGPFTEADYDAAGDADWGLLVQNVEQFHTDTAALLRHFSFAPRWLMDDIMVSFSAPGGSIGPHLDSYHVFLVQGQGRRRWKVSHEPIMDEVMVEGMELKLLDGGFEGEEIEVGPGDVLYVPPRFGHEGTTLEAALTYSVGFLGPKLSELLIGYGQYLSEFEDLDGRYVGEGLDADSAGFQINGPAVADVQARLSDHLNAKEFTHWLVEFFTESSHEGFGNFAEREDLLSAEEFEGELRSGAGLIKPEYVKFVVTPAGRGEFCLGFDTHSYVFGEIQYAVIEALVTEDLVDLASLPTLLDAAGTLEILRDLYNHQGLEFA